MRRAAGAVRGGTCDTCGQPVGARDARWCGSCGAAQTAPHRREGDRDASRPDRPDRRTVPAVVAVLALVALLIGTSGGLIDRVADGGTRAGTGVSDVAVAGLDADEVSGVLDDAARRPPTPLAGRTAPVCAAGGLACFVWVVEAEHPTGFGEVLLADGLVLSHEHQGDRVVAHDLRDGSVRWTAEVGRRFAAVHGGFHVVGDLLVLTEGDEVVGRDLATGRVRWRTHELGRLAPFELSRSGDTLVLAGEDRRGAGWRERAVAAAVDIATGEVRFREVAVAVSLGAEGMSLLTTEEGDVVLLGPDGAPRWELDAAVAPDHGSAWVTGHVVTIHDESGGLALLRARDGAPLDLIGWPFALDDTHTLVELAPATDAQPARSTHALLDRDGEVWRTGDGPADCVHDLHLRGHLLELIACTGEVVRLDRTDGALVSRRDAPLASGEDRFVALVGPYGLAYGPAHGEEQTVVDRRDGRIVARLPTDSWPVSRHGYGGWEPPAGEVVVLQHRRYLVALPGGPAPAHGGPIR